MNSGNPKLSAEEASARRRLLMEIVAHLPSEEVVNYYVATLRELVPIPDELRAEAIAFFHEARERKAEEARDGEDQGDDEEEVVLLKPAVSNPYASKPKEKKVAKVFRIADGLYRGGDTPPKKKGRGKGGKGGRPKGSKNKEGHRAGGNRKGLQHAKPTKGQLTLSFDEPTEDTADINEDGVGGDQPCVSNGGGGSGDGG